MLLYKPLRREYFPVAKFINRIKQSYRDNWIFLLAPLQVLLIGFSCLLGSPFNLIVFLIIYTLRTLDIRIQGHAKTAPQRKKIKTAGKQKRKAIKQGGKEKRKFLWTRFFLRILGFFIIVGYIIALVTNFKITVARTMLVFEGIWWLLIKIYKFIIWTINLFN